MTREQIKEAFEQETGWRWVEEGEWCGYKDDKDEWVKEYEYIEKRLNWLTELAIKLMNTIDDCTSVLDVG